MKHLIDKDALVAEVKKLKAELPKNRGYKRNAYNHVLHIIDSFEVKGVDLEKSISDWLFEGLPNDEELIDYIKETAKYFFELGLKVKGI